jgi:hypothetical protein
MAERSLLMVRATHSYAWLTSISRVKPTLEFCKRLYINRSASDRQGSLPQRLA